MRFLDKGVFHLFWGGEKSKWSQKVKSKNESGFYVNLHGCDLSVCSVSASLGSSSAAFSHIQTFFKILIFMCFFRILVNRRVKVSCMFKKYTMPRREIDVFGVGLTKWWRDVNTVFSRRRGELFIPAQNRRPPSVLATLCIWKKNIFSPLFFIFLGLLNFYIYLLVWVAPAALEHVLPRWAITIAQLAPSAITHLISSLSIAYVGHGEKVKRSFFLFFCSLKQVEGTREGERREGGRKGGRE